VVTIYYAGNVISQDTVLCFCISTARIKCTDQNVAVYCGYFMSCFPAKLFRKFLSDSETVIVSPIITGISFAFTLNGTIIDL
jgi:hypothetical protein